MKSVASIQKSKEKPYESFSKSVNKYHEKAEIQQKVAKGLTASIKPWKEIIPTGKVLEVGCGTGFLSELMLQEFPDREFVLSDASSNMVEFTKNRLQKSERVEFQVLNVDDIKDPKPTYSLIISNFAAQWFEDTSVGLEILTKMLKPGGLLLTAFPGNKSFMEWYECCLELGLPYTVNPLPNIEEVAVKLSLSPVQLDYYENDLFQDFQSSMEFFRHLKEIGAGTSTTGKSLSYKQLKLLTNFWDKKASNNIKAKWHVVYLAVKKDMI